MGGFWSFVGECAAAVALTTGAVAVIGYVASGFSGGWSTLGWMTLVVAAVAAVGGALAALFAGVYELGSLAANAGGTRRRRRSSAASVPR